MRWAVIFVAVGLVSAPAVAQAQSPQGATSSSGGASTGGSPNTGGAARTPARQPSPGRQAINRGNTAFVARDYGTALTAFRDGATHDDERAESSLGIAYTQLAQGDRDAALTTFRDIARTTTAPTQALHHLRALQAIGNTLETLRRWDDARTAWQEFVSYAEAHPDIGSAANGRARVEAIERRAALDTQFQPVRQRIEERRRINATAPPAR